MSNTKHAPRHARSNSLVGQPQATAMPAGSVTAIKRSLMSSCGETESMRNCVNCLSPAPIARFKAVALAALFA